MKYWIILILIFILSTPAMAQEPYPRMDEKQRVQPGSNTTNKQAKKELRAEAKKEKDVRKKENKEKKKAEKTEKKAQHKGFFKRRRKEKEKPVV